MPTRKLSEIASLAQANYDAEDRSIEGLHTLLEATPNHVTFLHDSRYEHLLSKTQAAAVFVTQKHLDQVPSHTIPLIVDNPYMAIAKVSYLFAHTPSVQTQPPTCEEGVQIDPSVRFGVGVKIKKNTIIMAGCYIGDGVEIGEGSILYPNVTLYHETIIGDKCIIHSGTVIGSDGFGFAPSKEGHIKIYQNGNVCIGNGVEIGANCTIDRAVFGSTVIEDGTKLDNLIQIAHNCHIGKRVLIASQVGLSGTTTIGNDVMIGGQSGTAGHLKIGDGAIIYAKSGVTKSLEGGKTYAGFPAIEMTLWRRLQAIMMRLLKQKRK